MFTEFQVNAFFKALSDQWPDAKTELEYANAFQLLVAVVLSAQATDKSVNKVGATLFKTIKTPQDVINLGEYSLKNAIKTIGLSNTKARNVMALSHLLIKNFDSNIPNTREDLESLPGVGRKTANVVLNVIFKQPTIAVDTHIFRICNRTKIAMGVTPYLVEIGLEKIVPSQYKLNCHHLLILHARHICQARKPLCHECMVSHLCQYEAKNL